MFEEVKTWTLPAAVETIRDYVMLTHAPAPGDTFYAAWGYNQWLIRTYQKDFEQLTILCEPAYQQYRLALMLKGYELMEDALRGRPLVRATHIIKRFLQTSVAVGHLGVVMDEGDGTTLVLFLRGNPLFKPIFDWIPNDQIERLPDVFDNAAQLNELTDWTTITGGSDMAGRFITGLSGKQADWDYRHFESAVNPETVYYVVNQYSGSIGYDNYTVEVVPAQRRVDGKGWKKGAIPARNKLMRVFAIGTAELERIRIVQ